MLTLTVVAALCFAGSPEEERPSLEWLDGPHPAVVERARREERPLLTYFWADTENCRRLYAETMSSEAVAGELAGTLLYSANAQSETGRKLFEEYGLSTVPALLLHSADGEVAEVLLGFMDPPTLTGELQRVARGENTIPSLRRKLAEASAELEEDLAVRRMLGDKLLAFSKVDEARALEASIVERDPKGATPTGASAHARTAFERLGEELHAKERELAAKDLTPLRKAFTKLQHPLGRFQALSDLGAYQIESGFARDALGTFDDAWKSRPKEDQAVIATALGWIEAIEHLEGATSRDRKFSLEVARELVALSELPPKPCEACAAGEEDGCGEGEGCQSAEEGTSRTAYLQFRLARCQAGNGETKAAIATMKRVTELAPEEADYVAYLKELSGESEG